MTIPRVRFAPSPTGQLHLGGARTALSNYLYAKNQGGKFLLRIEDTDLERSKKEYIDQICDSLKWLGLKWDDEIVYQSDNKSLYNHWIGKILETKKAYRCFASKDELDSYRNKKGSLHYPGIWRDRSTSDVNKQLEKGTPFTIRIKTPITGETKFTDLIYGEIIISNTEIDDFILVRSDGTPVYNFTNVIDDYNMKITNVIRGEDHISNTSKQILIYDILGFKKPEFAHLPMILGEDQKRLSKRHGATGVNEYREMGYQSSALINYLAFLGWSPGSEEEIFDLNQLVDKFDLSKVQKKSAIFDSKKLNWISSRHLLISSNMSILKSLKRLDASWGEQKKQDCYLKIIELLKPRSNTFIELIEKSNYFFNDPKQLDNSVKIKIWKSDTSKIINTLISALEKIQNWESIELETNVKEFIKNNGLGFGSVLKPIRFAICGVLDGPSLFEIMEILNKDSVIRRLNKAILEFK